VKLLPDDFATRICAGLRYYRQFRDGPSTRTIQRTLEKVQADAEALISTLRNAREVLDGMRIERQLQTLDDQITATIKEFRFYFPPRVSDDGFEHRGFRAHGGSPHAHRELLRYHVFQALESLTDPPPLSPRRGVAARVMAAVLEEADRLDGRRPQARGDFNGKQWRDWLFEYDNG
jgi:hypothetical protein